MRRGSAIRTGFGVALTALVGINGAATAGTTPPTAPTAATAALLVLADFPRGWTEEVEEVPTDQERAYQADVAACADGTGDNLLDLGGEHAQTGDFVGPDDERVEQSVEIVEQSVAEDFMARFGAPGVDACFRDAVRTFIAENFANPQDPSQSLPGDVSVDDVTVEALTLAPAGDESVAYRVTLTMTIAGVELDAFVDIVAVRAGGSLAGLTFQSLFEPFPAAQVEQYTATAAERLPG